MKNVYLMVGIVTVVAISIIFFVCIPKSGIDTNQQSFERDELDNKGFEEVKKEFQSDYMVISKIPKKYYTRPEFYPNYETYKNQTIKGQFGYGAYPGEVTYNFNGLTKDQYIDVYTFVISSFGVYTYQGMKLILKSPDDSLFETYVEPSDILLLPLNMTEQAVGQEDGEFSWAYRIKMKIATKKDIPEGKYIFKLRAGAPSNEKRQEYLNITNNTMYVDGGIFQTEKFFDFMLYSYN